MRTTKAMRSSLLAALAAIAWGTASGVSHATPDPVYDYAMVYVSAGLEPPVTDEEHGAGPVYAEAGDFCWFHGTASGCSGLPMAAPGAVAAWGEASADAAAGSAALEVEAFNYGVPDPLFQLPPHDDWGKASSYAYLRTTWEVASTDPSLELGDPVELELSLLLEGIFDLHPGTDPDRGQGSARLTFMLNHSADTVWLEEDFYLDEYRYLGPGTFADVLGGYWSGTIDFQGYGVSNVDGPVSLGETRAIMVQVGEVITLEVGVSAGVVIENTNTAGLTDPFYIEGDFAHTFSQSLEATTPGALLTLVPEPGTALLMTLGLSGLAVFGRRRGRS
jgi:hypothetical protein